MSPVTSQQPAGRTEMSMSTQPTIDNVEQQVEHKHACEKRGGLAGSILRLRGGGAGKDCFIGCIGCFLCCECCEGICDCVGDIICCPCETFC